MRLKEFMRSSRLKPFDGIIIVLLIASSFLPLIIFGWNQLPENAVKQALLRVDGKEIETFELVEGKMRTTYLYKDTDGDTN